MRKKLVAIALCLVLMIFTAGCGGNNRQSVGTGKDDIVFWSTYSTEKVLQSLSETTAKEYDLNTMYDEVKKQAVIAVESCKGEYESTQIIMSAVKNIKAYNVEVSDLLGTKGEGAFLKDNISVFHQKYIAVNSIYDTLAKPVTGMYPDALVPLKNIVASKENKIAAGENQGVYITFKVPVSQPSGIYTGSMKFTYDGNEKSIPVTLTVFNFAISEETHSRSSFRAGWFGYLSELDSSHEMYREYTEFFTEYRLSTGRVMHYDSIVAKDDSYMQTYIDEVYELIVNHKLPSYDIPFVLTTTASGVTTVDKEIYIKYLVALAEKSLQTGIDILDKAFFYPDGIDEPFLDTATLLPRVKEYVKDTDAGKAAAKTQIAALAESKYPQTAPAFVARLGVSVDNIPLIVTTDKFYSSLDQLGVTGWCPQIQDFSTEEQRGHYAFQEQKWTYTCIHPKVPYPTYHLEDTLVSARSLSWMMSEYDITGNLFWASDLHARYNLKNEVYEWVEDYYDDPNRYPGVNGDGVLVYPGAQYGVYGPIASMRLEAIRDGNEDYEILYAMKEAYANAGESPSAMQRAISDAIYSGTIVNGDSAQLAVSRKAAIELAALATSAANVCIYDVQESGTGIINFKLKAKSGYIVKRNGDALTPSGNEGAYSIYSVAVYMDDYRNILNISTEVDGREYRFDFDLGGEIVNYTATELLNETNTFTAVNAAVSAAIVSGAVKLEIGAVTNAQQSIRYNSSVLSSMNANTKKFIIRITNPTETEIRFRLLARFAGDDVSIELINQRLSPGLNIIEVDVSSYHKKISYADFIFSETVGTYSAKTVGLNSLTVFAA